MARTFAAMAAGYRNLWRTMTVTRPAACEAAAARIRAGRERYREVERRTGAPWFFVGLIHLRESACNFAGVLHNGERIIGTGRQTRLVPAGRGPFATWEEAAVDALRGKGLHLIREWPVERIGYEAERFNGFGYVARKINSPYVWAGSNHYARGKFVRDGVYDASHVDAQLGVMPVLHALARQDAEVGRRVGVALSPAPEIAAGGGVVGTTAALGAQAGWGFWQWSAALAAALALAILAAWLVRRARRPSPAPEMISDASGAIDLQRGGAAVDPPADGG
jgi:lysozyme family protein